MGSESGSSIGSGESPAEPLVNPRSLGVGSATGDAGPCGRSTAAGAGRVPRVPRGVVERDRGTWERPALPLGCSVRRSAVADGEAELGGAALSGALGEDCAGGAGARARRVQMSRARSRRLASLAGADLLLKRWQ